jgi:hypothetical protein
MNVASIHTGRSHCHTGTDMYASAVGQYDIFGVLKDSTDIFRNTI